MILSCFVLYLIAFSDIFPALHSGFSSSFLLDLVRRLPYFNTCFSTMRYDTIAGCIRRGGRFEMFVYNRSRL